MILPPASRTPKAKSLAQMETDFTAEGAPPPDKETTPSRAPDDKAETAARHAGDSVDHAQKGPPSAEPSSRPRSKRSCR